MTHIVKGFPTKKALREAVAAFQQPVMGTLGRIEFSDPSHGVNPVAQDHYIQGMGFGTYRTSLKVGGSLVCTNHPKRSWFARVIRTPSGIKVE